MRGNLTRRLISPYGIVQSGRFIQDSHTLWYRWPNFSSNTKGQSHVAVQMVVMSDNQDLSNQLTLYVTYYHGSNQN